MSRPIRALSRSEKMRLLGGLVVQPFVAGGIAFVTFPLLLLDRHGRTLAGGYPVDVTDAAVSVALGVGIVAGLVTVVGVLPVAVWLMKRRDLALKEALGVGVGTGNLVYVLLGVAAGGTYGIAGLLRGIVFASLLGLVGSALFWMLSIRPQRLRHREAAG